MQVRSMRAEGRVELSVGGDPSEIKDSSVYPLLQLLVSQTIENSPINSCQL